MQSGKGMKAVVCALRVKLQLPRRTPLRLPVVTPKYSFHCTPRRGSQEVQGLQCGAVEILVSWSNVPPAAAVC